MTPAPSVPPDEGDGGGSIGWPLLLLLVVAGVALLELMSRSLGESEMFRNPEVDFGVAVSATVLLVVAGGVAGFFPARKAAAIRPVEALRDE